MRGAAGKILNGGSIGRSIAAAFAPAVRTTVAPAITAAIRVRAKVSGIAEVAPTAAGALRAGGRLAGIGLRGVMPMTHGAAPPSRTSGKWSYCAGPAEGVS